jgi:hypothetical protein
LVEACLSEDRAYRPIEARYRHAAADEVRSAQHLLGANMTRPEADVVLLLKLPVLKLPVLKLPVLKLPVLKLPVLKQPVSACRSGHFFFRPFAGNGGPPMIVVSA